MAKGDLIEVKYDKRQLKAVERQVRGIPGAMKRIMPRAINRTATTARARIARKLAGQIKVKISTAKKDVSIVKARRDCWKATLKITTGRIPLILFGARQTKKGVSYRIDKTGSRKSIKSAFIQTMPITGATQQHEHRGVFVRKDKAKYSEGLDIKGRLRKGRLPIRELFGPSIGIVFEQASGIAAETIAETGAELQKNIDSQVSYVLSRARRVA